MHADVGSAAWISCAGHLPFGQPDDQRSDDAWSLVYDWELDEELEILGHPRLAVRVGSSAPVAFLSAKLCDVFPDGTSALVARGFLNLAQRRSRTDPEPMRPGVVEAVEVELDGAFVGVPCWAPAAAVAGRDRLAEPGPAAGAGGPDRGTGRVGAHPPGARWARPEPAAPRSPRRARPTAQRPRPPPTHDPCPAPPDPPTRWRVVRDVLGRRTEAEIDHGSQTKLPDGAVLVERYQGTVGTALDPGPTWARGSASYRVEWPEATVATSVRLDLRGDADAFEVRLDLEAREGDELRWSRTWRRRIPRHLG